MSVRVVSRPAHRHELVQALLSWAAVVRPTTHAAHVYEDVETPGVFGVLSEWDSWSVLGAHLRSDAFGVFAGALRVLGEPHGLNISRADDVRRKDVARAMHQPWRDDATCEEPS